MWIFEWDRVGRNLEAFEQLLDRGDQRGIVDCGRIPDNGILGSKVAVGKDVTKSGDGAPWNLRDGIGEFGGQMFYRLADNLEWKRIDECRLMIVDF